MDMPLKTLLILSLGGTLLGLSLMLLRRLLGKKLPSAFYYYAWLLVFLRFLLPLQGWWEASLPWWKAPWRWIPPLLRR